MRSGTAKYAVFFLLILLLVVHAGAVAPGRLTVVSSPSYAKVCVDAGRCDRTPADIGVAGNSWYNVSVTAAGYLPWSESVFVTAGQATLVRVDLESNSPKGGVQVFVNPGGGQVCLDDMWCEPSEGATGGEGRTLFVGVPEGFHTIRINNTEGYRTYAMTRYVTPKGISFYVTLDPVTPGYPESGTLRVLVDHTGSTVCLDRETCHTEVYGAYGSMTGTTDFSGVVAGVPHLISVVADGFEPWTANLSISPAQVNTVRVVLRPLMVKAVPPMAATEPTPSPTTAAIPPGRLTVISLPSSAKACVDDTACDTTPADFPVSGNAWHTVTVRCPGYQSWSGSVFALAGRASLVSADLQPASPVPGLEVSVNPGGGMICLDDTWCQVSGGAAAGTLFRRVSEGYHSIRVNNTEGYRTFSVQRYVKAEGITSVSINLEPVTAASPEAGTIRVLVNRYGSTICVDATNCRTRVGGTTGPGPGSADFTNITAGTTHTITVRVDGFEPWSANLSITPDQINEVRVSLRPLEVVPDLYPAVPLPAFQPIRAAIPPGRVTILSKPSYAHVCIDETKCGTTPVDFAVAGNREHNLTITRSGYLDWSDTVYLPAGGTTIVNASLVPDTGINGIQVFVNPGGGTVCLDDRQCHTAVGAAGNGSTQFTDLSEGYHLITVNNTPGYQSSAIRPYVPRRGFASITINMDPVTVPGTSQTATPAGFTTLPVTSGENIAPTPVLEHGRLRVYVNPIGSTVCIDNGDCRTNVGGTPGPGIGFEDFTAVSANIPHTISVTAGGFLPASSQVTVSPEKVSSLSFVLQPAPPATTEATHPAVTTPTPTQSGPGEVWGFCILSVIIGFTLFRRE